MPASLKTKVRDRRAAERAAESAKLLLEAGDADGACNCAYYAMVDAARGGDIDILVYSKADPLKLFRRVATRFFMQCEERIDVVVMNPRRLTREQRAFLATLDTERIA